MKIRDDGIDVRTSREKMDTVMNILMVTPRFLPEMGGIETHVYEVSRRLVAMGHAVTVLTTDRSGHLLPTEQMQGVQVHRVSAWPKQRDYYVAPAIYHRGRCHARSRLSYFRPATGHGHGVAPADALRGDLPQRWPLIAAAQLGPLTTAPPAGALDPSGGAMHRGFTI